MDATSSSTAPPSSSSPHTEEEKTMSSSHPTSSQFSTVVWLESGRMASTSPAASVSSGSSSAPRPSPASSASSSSSSPPAGSVPAPLLVGVELNPGPPRAIKPAAKTNKGDSGKKRKAADTPASQPEGRWLAGSDSEESKKAESDDDSPSSSSPASASQPKRARRGSTSRPAASSSSAAAASSSSVIPGRTGGGFQSVHTSGIGFIFEHCVQALYLLHYLCDQSYPTLGGLQAATHCLKLQQKHAHETDDLVIETTHPSNGKKLLLLMSCKRTIELVPSFNDNFSQSIRDFYVDYMRQEEEGHLTHFILAFEYCPDGSLDDCQTALALARGSMDLADFQSKVGSSAAKNKKQQFEFVKRILKLLDNMSNQSKYADYSRYFTPELQWQFLQCIHLDQYKFEREEGSGHDLARQFIQRHAFDPSRAQAIWSELVLYVGQWNGVGSTLHYKRDLQQGTIPAKIALYFKASGQKLKESWLHSEDYQRVLNSKASDWQKVKEGDAMSIVYKRKMGYVSPYSFKYFPLAHHFKAKESRARLIWPKEKFKAKDLTLLEVTAYLHQQPFETIRLLMVDGPEMKEPKLAALPRNRFIHPLPLRLSVILGRLLFGLPEVSFFSGMYASHPRYIGDAQIAYSIPELRVWPALPPTLIDMQMVHDLIVSSEPDCERRLIQAMDAAVEVGDEAFWLWRFDLPESVVSDQSGSVSQLLLQTGVVRFFYGTDPALLQQRAQLHQLGNIVSLLACHGRFEALLHALRVTANRPQNTLILNEYDEEGRTPLLSCLNLGDPHSFLSAILLLQRGADVSLPQISERAGWDGLLPAWCLVSKFVGITYTHHWSTRKESNEAERYQNHLNRKRCMLASAILPLLVSTFMAHAGDFGAGKKERKAIRCLYRRYQSVRKDPLAGPPSQYLFAKLTKPVLQSDKSGVEHLAPEEREELETAVQQVDEMLPFDSSVDDFLTQWQISTGQISKALQQWADTHCAGVAASSALQRQVEASGWRLLSSDKGSSLFVALAASSRLDISSEHLPSELAAHLLLYADYYARQEQLPVQAFLTALQTSPPPSWLQRVLESAVAYLLSLPIHFLREAQVTVLNASDHPLQIYLAVQDGHYFNCEPAKTEEKEEEKEEEKVEAAADPTAASMDTDSPQPSANPELETSSIQAAQGRSAKDEKVDTSPSA